MTVGVLLAGGTGTRLSPISQFTNKHLLPIYNKPLIYYSLSLILMAKIRKLAIVCNPNEKLQFKPLCEKLGHLGVEAYLIEQQSADGIPSAVKLTQNFVNGDDILLVLGDNIVYGQNLPLLLQKAAKNRQNALIFIKRVNDPQRYGVAVFGANGQLQAIEEKPKNFISDHAIIGVYKFPNDIFDKINLIKPSKRGETEIVDVLRLYMLETRLKCNTLGRGVAWLDAGTYDSLLEASNFVHFLEKQQNLMVGSIEEISLRNKWIDEDTFRQKIIKEKKSGYENYLSRICDEIF